MSNEQELEIRVREIQAGLDAMCAKNQMLYKEIADLQALFKKEKRAWVDLEDEDLREIGIDGPIKYTWAMVAQQKLKELNS